MALHALARNPEQEGQVKLFIPQTQHVEEGPELLSTVALTLALSLTPSITGNCPSRSLSR